MARQAPLRSSPAGAYRRSARARTATVRLGSGIPPAPASRLPAPARLLLRHRTGAGGSPRLIWFPIVCTGLSDVIGSWNTIAISAPRILRIKSLCGASLSGQASYAVPHTAVIEDLPPHRLARLRHDAQDRARRYALSTAALAHHAQGLSAMNRNSPHPPRAPSLRPGKSGLQVFYFNEYFLYCSRLFS
jgi:hypothetical protein